MKENDTGQKLGCLWTGNDFVFTYFMYSRHCCQSELLISRKQSALTQLMLFQLKTKKHDTSILYVFSPRGKGSLGVLKLWQLEGLQWSLMGTGGPLRSLSKALGYTGIIIWMSLFIHKLHSHFAVNKSGGWLKSKKFRLPCLMTGKWECGWSWIRANNFVLLTESQYHLLLRFPSLLCPNQTHNSQYHFLLEKWKETQLPFPTAPPPTQNPR